MQKMQACSLAIASLFPAACALTQAPPRTENVQPPSPTDVSYATVGAKISLKGLEQFLEKEVQSAYEDHGNATEWTTINVCWPGKCEVKTKWCDWEWFVKVTRTPFEVRPIVNGVGVTARYRLWGRVKTHGPLCPKFQETTEPDGQLTMTITTKPAFNELYALRPNVDYSWRWIVRPGIKLGGVIKVRFGTKAGEAIDKGLTKARDKLNADLAARLDWRNQVEKGWAQLHDPIPISNDGLGWLQIKPLGLYATSVSSDSAYARLYAGLKSKNEVQFGPRPLPYDRVDLPILKPNMPRCNEFDVTALASLDYAAVVDRVKGEWVGKTLQLDWGKLQFRDFKAYQSGDRLVLGASVKIMPRNAPYVSGWLYLVGRPKVEGERLFFEDLDYVANVNNPLVRLVAFLFREPAKRELQSKLSFDLHEPIEVVKAKLNSLQPMPVGSFGTAQLRVSKIDVRTPVADSKWLRVPVRAKGNMEAVFFPYGDAGGVEESPTPSCS